MAGELMPSFSVWLAVKGLWFVDLVFQHSFLWGAKQKSAICTGAAHKNSNEFHQLSLISVHRKLGFSIYYGNRSKKMSKTIPKKIKKKRWRERERDSQEDRNVFSGGYRIHLFLWHPGGHCLTFWGTLSRPRTDLLPPAPGPDRPISGGLRLSPGGVVLSRDGKDEHFKNPETSRNIPGFH